MKISVVFPTSTILLLLVVSPYLPQAFATNPPRAIPDDPKPNHNVRPQVFGGGPHSASSTPSYYGESEGGPTPAPVKPNNPPRAPHTSKPRGPVKEPTTPSPSSTPTRRKTGNPTPPPTQGPTPPPTQGPTPPPTQGPTPPPTQGPTPPPTQGPTPPPTPPPTPAPTTCMQAKRCPLVTLSCDGGACECNKLYSKTKATVVNTNCYPVIFLLTSIAAGATKTFNDPIPLYVSCLEPTVYLIFVKKITIIDYTNVCTVPVTFSA